MRQKIIKSTLYTYHAAEWDGVNRSGYQPFGDRVLVMVDIAPTTTKGKIIIPGTSADQQQQAAETGIIIAVGEGAFAWNSDRTRPGSGDAPKVGERVYFERYAGQYLMGADEVMYRVMDDKCVAAREIESVKRVEADANQGEAA